MEFDEGKMVGQLGILNKELEHLDSKKQISLQEYISSMETQYFVERAFQKAIEACINIGNHIISRNNLGNAGSFSGVFKILGHKGIIPLELSEKFIKIARFRNKLVHLYWEIDPEEVHKYLQNNIKDLREFYDKVQDLIKE